MNVKEKILFIASPEFVNYLNSCGFEYQTHNRLYFCHLGASLFLTAGVTDLGLTLEYKYKFTENYKKTEEYGICYKVDGVRFEAYGDSFVQLENKECSQTHILKNKILGTLDCMAFSKKLQIYVEDNLKYEKISFLEFAIIDKSRNFKEMFINFKISKRKSFETQQKFLNLLTDRSPECEKLLNYLSINKNLVKEIGSISQSKPKLKL